MCSFPSIKKILAQDWFLGLVLFLIFLSNNGYTFGWDDQHLEVPMLKSLIDPTLYHGDYYVESLKQNFTSFLFPILAKFIRVTQIQTTYFILYLGVRFIFFWGSYKLWRILAGGNRWVAFCCVLMLITIGRVEEFLYRTFSHEEFSFAFIIFGFTFFFRNQFLKSAFLWGIAANFHILYALFPMTYQLFFLFLNKKEIRIKNFFMSGFVFCITASPVLIWIIKKRFLNAGIEMAGADPNWLNLYMLACPQNFLFQYASIKAMSSHLSTFLQATPEFWGLVAFTLLNLVHNPSFKNDKKTRAIIFLGTIYLVVSFVFTYVFPSRFILDLNLIRNTQFMYFFLYGYTTILWFRIVDKEPLWLVFLIALIFPFVRLGFYIRVLAALLILFILCARCLYTPKQLGYTNAKFRRFIYGVLALICAVGIAWQISTQKFSASTWNSLVITESLLLLCFLVGCLAKKTIWQLYVRPFFVFLPLFVVAISFMFYHHARYKIERQGTGFWQLQRNWEDMQKYARDHTPKNALFMVPYNMEMGGFRIFSERRIICCYRDCGIVGFDYSAALEWQRRIKDIEPFKVFITQPITPALEKALLKYKANYIVFMNYVRPGTNPVLKHVYSNDVFSLYQVLPNPTPQVPIN